MTVFTLTFYIVI